MPNSKQTSKKIATLASLLLRTSNSKNVRRVAGTALSQARGKTKKR